MINNKLGFSFTPLTGWFWPKSTGSPLSPVFPCRGGTLLEVKFADAPQNPMYLVVDPQLAGEPGCSFVSWLYRQIGDNNQQKTPEAYSR